MTDTRTSASGEASVSLPPRKSMIYVVDDDYDVRTSLRFLLETEGFDVRTFRSGVALLGSSTRNRADCLVVDYKMAELDGLELALRLRRLPGRDPDHSDHGLYGRKHLGQGQLGRSATGAFEAQP
jgi:two-component system, LuxR family, response regulator FixJ